MRRMFLVIFISITFARVIEIKSSKSLNSCKNHQSSCEFSDFPDVSAFEQPEAVNQRSSVKEVFLEISENSRENTCDRVSF